MFSSKDTEMNNSFAIQKNANNHIVGGFILWLKSLINIEIPCVDFLLKCLNCSYSFELNEDCV